MFSALASIEGFDTTISQYHKNQNYAYNQYLPNIIPSNILPGKELVDISPALRSIHPQNDIQQPSRLFTAIPLVSENAQKQNAACMTATSISDVIDQGATQCGWFYKPPTTPTSPIPQYNRGFLTSGGAEPAPLLNAPQPTDYQYTYSDHLPDGQKLADGKKRILGDICKSLRTCTDVAKTPYNNLCGYCTDINQGVPIDNSTGAALYTGPNIGCRPEALIRDATKCPLPPINAVPPKNGCLPGQPFSANCLRDALVQTGCDNGTLIQSLQGWTKNSNTNMATLQGLRAINDYNKGGNPTFDFSTYLGTGTNPSQTDAIKVISDVLSYTGTANTTLKGYASRELCANPNALDDYDFCSDLSLTTPKPKGGWDLICLQRAFKQAGGTSSGKQYPATAISPGTTLFNGMSNWGQVTDWMNRRYSQARGTVVQGFSPSQFGGNTDAFEDIRSKTTTDYQKQNDALNDMLGTVIQSIPDWKDIAVKGNWFQDPAPGARLNTIAILDDTSIIGTNSQQGIWSKSSPEAVDWHGIPGSLVQIDAKGPNLIVGVHANGNVYQYNNSGKYASSNNWRQIGVRAQWASIGTDGTIVISNKDRGDLYIYDGINTWSPIPGVATQISVQNANNMWAVNSSDEIWNSKDGGYTWTSIPGFLTRVAVSSDGKVAGVSRPGDIFVYSDKTSNWLHIPGKAINISICPTYIAVTNSSANIYYLNIAP